MPAKLKGHKLTPKDHRQWKHVMASTGSAAQATSVVERTMAARRRKRK